MGRPYKGLTEDKRKEKASEQKDIAAITVENVLNILIDSNYPVIKIEKPKERGSIKYSKIVEDYDIKTKKNLIWIKFAMKKNDCSDKRYVGVVGAGYDINRRWKYTHMSGRIVHHVNLEWDYSVVLIIPVKTSDIKARDDYEKEIGNLLIEKKVPIIDYYSHDFGLFKRENASTSDNR